MMEAKEEPEWLREAERAMWNDGDAAPRRGQQRQRAARLRRLFILR